MTSPLSCIWNRNTGLSQTKLNFGTDGCSAGNDVYRSTNNLAKQNYYAMRFSRADSHQKRQQHHEDGDGVSKRNVGRPSHLFAAVYPRKFH